MSFINLHNHSCYSLLDGAQTPKQMVERAKELGQDTIALTDHGNMHGIIKFWDACKKGGVKPIIGLEAYAAPVSRTHKEAIENMPPAFHLTLLAKNRTGLINLYKLSSQAFLEGFYYKPRIDNALLASYSEGLICLSGCLKSKIQWYLSKYVETEDKGWLELAETEAGALQTIFGPDLFIEFQRIVPIQEKLIPLQVKLCAKLDIHGVATCDTHYARPEDVDFHEQVLCLSTGKTIKDEKRMGKMEGLYIKSEEEMRELWKDYPVLIDNTQAIADACILNEEDVYGKADYIFPFYGDNDEEEFEAQCWEGLVDRGLDKRQQYKERLEYEIKTVKDMGFTSYFLVVSDYVRWAKTHNITVGPGRGSAAGSLAAYALGITDVDPMEYGLLFQRFLNKGRKSMPDIDVDFCMHRRGEVIAYLAERYGRDKVAQIATFSEFKPRGACRDFARVQGEPYALGERASKLVPPASRGREPKWDEVLKASPALLGPEYNDIIRMARKSEGLNKGRGIHAGGVIISRGPFEEVAPRCLGVGKNKEVASQWDMDDLERVGLVKMDILGLTALTVVDKTLQLITSAHGSAMAPSQIPKDCSKTFELIANGDTSGLFQLDTGGGIRTLCMQLRPQSISEIAAISALYRPGPLDSGVATEYVGRVTGKKPVSYLVPELEPVLKMTYGLLIYQEQAMRIATDLAGYDLESADDLRKAIGKKLPEKMAKEEEKLISGMTARGIAPDKARELWEMIKVFADYGFNKSHAVAYSFITYYTAYLKAHYPVEFYCALLTLHSDQRDKLMEYLGDCRKADIQVLPPDVNESNAGFAIHNGVIRFGLMAIVSVGEKVSRQIVLAREDGPFESIFDFYERVRTRGVNKRTIEALAKAGALTSLGVPRAGVLEILDDLVGYRKEVEKYEKKMLTYQKRTSACREREAERAEAQTQGRKGRPPLKEPQKPEPPPPVTVPDVEELEIEELMSLEKEMLGLYITSHPLYSYEADILRHTNAHTASLGDHSNGEFVTMLGVISHVKHITTRAGRKMAVIDLEDLHGHIEVTIFSRLYAEVQNLLEGENVILLAGKVEASDENIRKLIATSIRLLPKKTTKKKVKEPKEVRIWIDEAGEITDEMLDYLKDIIDICPGVITTSVDLQLGGFKYKLDRTAAISFEGVKQLRKQPGILVQDQPQ